MSTIYPSDDNSDKKKTKIVRGSYLGWELNLRKKNERRINLRMCNSKSFLSKGAALLKIFSFDTVSTNKKWTF